MNTFVKGIFLYGLGAATGAFVAIKLLEDHYAQMAEEEIEEIKEHSRKKIEEVIAKYEAECKTVLEKMDETVKQGDRLTKQAVYVRNKYEKMVTDYTKQTDLTEDNVDSIVEQTEYPREDDDYDELEEEMYEKEAESDGMNERYDVDPYLITDEEFANENRHYEKLTLWYYAVDGTLADDNEEIVDNADVLIGEGTLDMVEDERTIYIRNDRQGSDFEIICLNKSYSVEIMGESEEALNE